jgi:hypothetical protein
MVLIRFIYSGIQLKTHPLTTSKLLLQRLKLTTPINNRFCCTIMSTCLPLGDIIRSATK